MLMYKSKISACMYCTFTT